MRPIFCFLILIATRQLAFLLSSNRSLGTNTSGLIESKPLELGLACES